MSAEPRVVLVTRPTALEELLVAHGTLRQAQWALERQGQSLGPVTEAHERQQAALRTVVAGLPPTWRRTRIDRAALDRFLFEPDDLAVVVGQDGLVANVAKYLDDQPVLGINPDPSRIDGVLVRHPAAAARDLVRDLGAGRARTEVRTRVEAVTDDGQRLRALNEIFVGHRSHQSARYRLTALGGTERQSSSGFLVATGTGATGWAASIARASRLQVALPTPVEPAVVLLVREPWPSKSTGAALLGGRVDEVRAVSEMEHGGVLFGDGIEADALALPYGRSVTLRAAPRGLRLAA
jgi:hypothetical protein